MEQSCTKREKGKAKMKAGERLSSDYTQDGVHIFVEYVADSKRGRFALAQATAFFAFFDTLVEAKAALEVASTESGDKIREICRLVKHEYAREWNTDNPCMRITDNQMQRQVVYDVCQRLDGFRPIVTKGTTRWIK